MWTNEKFVKRFRDNTLGRKSQYGNLYVVEFPHCKILMHKLTHARQLVAIQFGEGLCVFNSNVTLRRVGISEFSIRIKDKNASESGLIDRDDKSYLFDLGTQRILLSGPQGSDEATMTPKQYIEDNSEKGNYYFWVCRGDPTTVIEAKKQMVPNVKGTFALGNSWLIPWDKSVPTISKADEDAIRSFPLPTDYGLGWSEIHYDSLRERITSNSARYQEALERHYDALQRSIRTYRRVRNFNRTEKRIDFSLCEQLHDDDNSSFVKGKVMHKGGSLTLTKWHKVHTNEILI